MSEPHDPSGGAGESGPAAPEQPAPPPIRVWGREGWDTIGLAGVLLLVVALVATGPLWAPLLPWAAQNEPTPDARQPAEGAASAALQGLDRRVVALEARPAAPVSDLAGIRQEVARLAARIDAIDQVAHSQTVGDPTDIALILALLQIRDAIEAGRPFAAAYDALVALAQARPEIAAAAAPLAEPATTGLPGRPVLANRLRELADAISTADAPAKAAAGRNAGEPDWADQVWRRLSDLVTIRRVDSAGQGQPGGGPAAAVNAALQALAGGDLDGAVGALDTLTGAPAETAGPWLRMAKQRLAAEDALQKIQALLVARLRIPLASGPPR
jgi:hypothetical protein